MQCSNPCSSRILQISGLSLTLCRLGDSGIKLSGDAMCISFCMHIFYVQAVERNVLPRRSVVFLLDRSSCRHALDDRLHLALLVLNLPLTYVPAHNYQPKVETERT